MSTANPEWTFETVKYGTERTSPLWWVWEVYCDPISDGYTVDEITAEELWREWLRRYPRDESAEAVYGPGAFSIHWFIEGRGTFEAAPFQELSHRPYASADDFLTFYTWPVDSHGEPVQWTRLPVVDKVWRKGKLPALHSVKGGFIQESTGWKPAPLQPFVNVRQLARAARLYSPPEG